MALTNAEKQKRWRERRNALVEHALHGSERSELQQRIAHLEGYVSQLELYAARLEEALEEAGGSL